MATVTPGFNSASATLTDILPLQWNAADHGFISWAFDPSQATATFTLTTGGTLYVVALKTTTRTVTNVVYNITTAGATLTTGQNWLGLYQAGVLLGSSADQTIPWVSTGVTTTALTLPTQVAQGIVYVAFVFNGTTGPTLAAGSVRGNANITATASRYGTAATSVTTALPAAVGTVAALAQSPWVALS